MLRELCFRASPKNASMPCVVRCAGAAGPKRVWRASSRAYWAGRGSGRVGDNRRCWNRAWAWLNAGPDFERCRPAPPRGGSFQERRPQRTIAPGPYVAGGMPIQLEPAVGETRSESSDSSAGCGPDPVPHGRLRQVRQCRAGVLSQGTSRTACATTPRPYGATSLRVRNSPRRCSAAAAVRCDITARRLSATAQRRCASSVN